MSAARDLTGPVGVGLIGAGTISDTYLENLTAFPDVSVVFVADLDVERARAQAQKHGVPRSGTVDELLADDEVEIVVNLTIPAAHVDVARQAVEAGKHVWSEKPFSLDRDSGRELLAEAAEKGVRVTAAPDTFLGAGLQTARRAIADGVIGEPVSALALFQTQGPERWHPNPEFYFSRGGGPLFDMGPYYLTALVQILGPVSRVSAVSSTARSERVVGSGPKAGTAFPVTTPTHIAGSLEFERGGTAQVVFSFDSALIREGVVEINGTEGTAVLPDPNHFGGDTTVWPFGADESVTVASMGADSSRGTGVLELARAIRGGVPDRVPGDLAFHIVDVMVSLAESGESGAPVTVTSTVVPSEPLPADWDPHAATV
ncbi:MAG: hypothetical protein RI885_1283 [Actinomycetota bacterium]